MRPVLVGILLVGALFAGCASNDDGPTLASVQTARLTGTVTTIALEPLAGARVLVPDSQHAAVTDKTGKYELTLPLGEWLVITQVEGFVNTAQRAHLDGPDLTLDFRLAPKPTQSASQRTYEAHGLLACAATLKTGDGHDAGASQTYTCGSNDPNDRASLDFFFEPEPGVTGIVVEMVWDPVTQAGRAFTLHAFQMQGETPEEIGETEGIGYARIVIPETVAQFRFAAGGLLRTLAVPAGSFLDEESPADFGVAFQQPFAMYVTIFSNAPAPVNYSVLD